MNGFIGIDIGAVSATIAVTGEGAVAPSVAGYLPVDVGPDRWCLISEYTRTKGQPIVTARAMVDPLIEALGAGAVGGVIVTGSGARAVAESLSAATVNEFRAIATGLSALGIEARTVFEMGGETSKYLLLEAGDQGEYTIADYATNGDCAAGTGSFIDQQAGRLKFAVEEIGDLCAATDRAAQVAGRCSVFAKSDMIHAQQKGYTPAEVLRGLCDAVARNFKTSVVRSHPIEAPVVFLGGVTANAAVDRAMRDAFNLTDDELIVPDVTHAHVLAIGAAMYMLAEAHASVASDGTTAGTHQEPESQAAPALSMENVLLLRDAAVPATLPDGERVDAYMGIDIGSVSTNVVILDGEGRLIREIYTRTKGRPIEVVAGALKTIEAELADRITIRGVGTTGSGRELIGQLVGADTINDEITAHKTGATYVGKTLLDGRIPDTIFEIGGQDSKYISLQEGVVVDFTMNEACAAGTGSFLEERAEELDISIKDEFAALALSSASPTRLGERCTVFMERDVNSFMQRGAHKADLVAGLAMSVVYNYINRVVRGRPVGETVFFQGGTAYNDAVAAAFAQVTGKQIIVPPHNGVMGAIGVALLAHQRMGAGTTDTRFRGYDLEAVDYSLDEFICKGCSNHCAIQQFTVEGEKTYWGDKCSERFRKRTASDKKPVIDDLFAMREEWMLDESAVPDAVEGQPTIGIPRAMFAWGQLAFWRTLLSEMGFRTVLSDATNQQIIQAGQHSVVAEPCFPIIVAHGHIANLIEKGVDWFFVPNILSQETQWTHTESHLCPWHQTMPFVTRRSPQLRAASDKFLSPLTPFRDGRKQVAKLLADFFVASQPGKQMRLKRAAALHAIGAGFSALDAFDAKLKSAGDTALATLADSDQPGIVLVGRPYNVHDQGMNLSVATKLRDTYGCNVIPFDMLRTSDIDVRDENENMYWDLGRTILAAGKIVAEHPNLHIIYITNFKCGPDSFIKHFMPAASGKPFLTLQFDSHANDAGMMTRCEAYLDSKGVL